MIDRSGQRIDSYNLVRLLGPGNFGDVYLSENIYRKTQVAIKLLHIRLTNEEIPNFLNEARIFRLRHPHIVPILDFGIEPTTSTPFLVMDYVPHGTLRKRHPKGTQVPLESVVQYVQQIAKALQYAHEEHLIHRDVKPENMLINQQQEILLSDFGVAVVFQTGRTSLQQSSKIAGTPYYMTPEQFRGKPQPASDQYALAIVTYEWLTGELPFTEGDFIQLGYQHNFETPAPMRNKLATLPPEVEQVVLKALSEETWKKDLREKPMRYALMGVEEYFAYDPNEQPLLRATNRRLFGWHLDKETAAVRELPTGPDGRGWSSHLDSFLVPAGEYLHLYDRSGQLRLTEAEALSQKLRSLGIDPDRI